MARPPLSDTEHAIRGTERRVTVPNVISLAAQGGRPKCGRHMSKAARKHWLAAVRLLESRSVLDPGAGATLELYAVTMDRWLQAKSDLDKRGLQIEETRSSNRGEIYTVTVVNPMLKVAENCEAALQQLTKTLGLAPDAREKVKKVKAVARANAEPAWLTKLKEQQDDTSEG
jgi:P27 family predicted phage terminase small subunit